ncbi:MAG: glycine--tRNA ligase subunit beta, partial [Caulobacteraceae bacterium]
MPELLVELFSEEIPARFQARAARDLEARAAPLLAAQSLEFESLRAFAGPRRLTLVAEGLPLRQPDRLEERKGPRVDAPVAAVEGFLRSTGLIREDLVEKEGTLFVRLERPGKDTGAVLSTVIEALVRNFPWPKDMRWGSGELRWVRPLHRILCVFDREIVPFVIDGIETGDVSEGHRFMGSAKPFRARDFAEYREALAGHFVVLSAADRARRILEGARSLCVDRGLELIEDGGLVEENAGLAEWPVPIFGELNERLLSLPEVVIRTSMRVHQRCFAARTAGGVLAPAFVVVANIEADDGGALIAAGAARVLAARLADAQFFFAEDRRTPLEAKLAKLRGMTFYESATMWERAMRLEQLAGQVAGSMNGEIELARRAGRLAKADLATSMVGEFPELQGIMGGLYAEAEGEDQAVATAIAGHYRPQGPSDEVPTEPVAMALALADKLLVLVWLFKKESPTGSRDPFGLRRAALGIIRIALENGLRFSLRAILEEAAISYVGKEAIDGFRECLEPIRVFVLERLKVALRDRGERHDLVDAVVALENDDLVLIVRRVEALAQFLARPEGADLLLGYRRAANILAAEAKKGIISSGLSRLEGSAPPEEEALFAALECAAPAVETALCIEDFAAAMAALAALRAPLDTFFDKVLVNSP